MSIPKTMATRCWMTSDLILLAAAPATAQHHGGGDHAGGHPNGGFGAQHGQAMMGQPFQGSQPRLQPRGGQMQPQHQRRGRQPRPRAWDQYPMMLAPDGVQTAMWTGTLADVGIPIPQDLSAAGARPDADTRALDVATVPDSR